jgi:hypothetical protein
MLFVDENWGLDAGKNKTRFTAWRVIDASYWSLRRAIVTG